MSQPFKEFSVGSRLFDIPGAPTVGRASSGRFTKLGEEIALYYRDVAAEALNDYADKVAHASLVEVPKGPHGDDHPEEEGGTLAESLRAPFNDDESKATEDFLHAYVSYDKPYADAQHEGVAVMVHHHPIIPARGGFFFEKTDVTAEITVEWRATHYTTPGTKDHFLSDPFKAYIPGFEPFMYERVRKAFAG